MMLGRFSFGIGDRFGCQGRAQLAAFIRAKELGVDVTPVWNKSNREHTIIGTRPSDVRKEADEAVRTCGWKGAYFVDADHIEMSNVDKFVEASDFFTVDVADFIAKTANQSDVDAFVKKRGRRISELAGGSGIAVARYTGEEHTRRIAAKYLLAVKQAGKIYRRIASVKGKDNFITEVSMDETDDPQKPMDLLVILAAMGEEGIPAQTVAPKFSGRFNKAVDYVGSVSAFAKEFQRHLMVVRLAGDEFGMPKNLKLSIHSGSDKFSIYGPIREAIQKFDAGLHIKTAGTSWLEELIGLATAGGEGLTIAREIYRQAVVRLDELCAPYEAVIDIDRAKLPPAKQVDEWDGQRFAAALRHDEKCEYYDANLRQLMHVAYKVAAEMGRRYTSALKEYEQVIAKNVTENIFERHIKPIFIG
jgi:hypothetical protein